KVIAWGTARARLQPCYFKPRLGEEGCNDRPYGAGPHDQDVDLTRGLCCPAMGIVSGYDFPLSLREVQVGQRANFASLIDMFVRQVLFGTVLEPNAGMTQNTPSRFITIATVNRTGKKSFLQVGAHQFEKGLGLDCLKIWR